MVGKVFRGLNELQGQPVGMLALIVVEVCDCPGVQELVEKPTAVPPRVPVTHGDIPGIKSHA